MKNRILITISLSLCLNCKGELKEEIADINIYDNFVFSTIVINSKIEFLADSIFYKKNLSEIKNFSH